MRADRLLSIMLLLQVHRRMTARQLAERLEVSERTIHRDMEALSITGVPVVAERGAGGGWTLPDGFQTNLTGLKPDEVQALFVSTPLRLLADLGLTQASEAARIKLQAALPEAHRGDAELLRQRIHVDMAGWHRSGEDLSFLPPLQDAVWQERQVLLSYARGDGTSFERQVEPLGLVAKGNVWYLVAAAEGEPRTYRISRVRAVTMTEQACTRPPGFDLGDHWAQSTASFVANLPRYAATLRVNPAILTRMRYAGRFASITQVGDPDAAGWVRVDMIFQTEEEACSYALSFGTDMEVLEPLPLRDQVLDMARRVVAFYEGR